MRNPFELGRRVYNIVRDIVGAQLLSVGVTRIGTMYHYFINVLSDSWMKIADFETLGRMYNIISEILPTIPTMENIRTVTVYINPITFSILVSGFIPKINEERGGDYVTAGGLGIVMPRDLCRAIHRDVQELTNYLGVSCTVMMTIVNSVEKGLSESLARIAMCIDSGLTTVGLSGKLVEYIERCIPKEDRGIVVLGELDALLDLATRTVMELLSYAEEEREE